MRGTEKVLINNNEIKLEAELYLSNVEEIARATLICHPHPQFFGIKVP